MAVLRTGWLVKAATAAIYQHLEQHNAEPKPFVWIASSAAILVSVGTVARSEPVTKISL